MSAYTPVVTGTGPRAAIQRFGAFLAGMIMPNLGAFIAWGLITALFIPTGWVNLIAGRPANNPLPFTTAAGQLVGPIIVFLIPVLIGYTGGRQVHGQRGAVVGAIATMGVVLSPLAYNPKLTLGDLGPQFLGALIIGPVTAFLLKLWDGVVDGKLKAGFEMLVDNFSAGIIGGAMAMVGLFWLGPVVVAISNAFGSVVQWLINLHLLPLAQIIIEPAKVLFLNNAIGNGVLVPLGATQAHTTGQSILFMLESDPGPGLGILLAMMLFGPRAVRPTVPAAIVVQFLGGIHEIYFPYVLMKPILIIAAILGGGCGVLTWVIFGVGLRAPASPGSIIAYLIECPPNEILTMLLGVVIAAAVAFVSGAFLLGFGRNERTAMDLDEANARNAENKGRKTAVAGA
jgi:mannitol PTS system EIICBA or EIICB component